MKLDFSQTLSESEVQAYFRANLPPDISREVLERTEGCLRDARLILGELGGPTMARIMWLEFPKEGTGHAWVVKNNARDEEIAYGSERKSMVRTNKYLREHGLDITDEVLSKTWDKL